MDFYCIEHIFAESICLQQAPLCGHDGNLTRLFGLRSILRAMRTHCECTVHRCIWGAQPDAKLVTFVLWSFTCIRMHPNASECIRMHHCSALITEIRAILKAAWNTQVAGWAAVLSCIPVIALTELVFFISAMQLWTGSRTKSDKVHKRSLHVRPQLQHLYQPVLRGLQLKLPLVTSSH